MHPKTRVTAAVRRAFRGLLKPAVKLLLQRGLGAREILRLTREAMVEVAEDEILRVSSKVNASRISVLTGVDRHEVREIISSRDRSAEADSEEASTLIAKIMTQWEQNPRFSKAPGKARKLKADGPRSEFFDLVASVNRGINPATVLFEMERRKIIRKTGVTIELLRNIQLATSDDSQALILLARDIAALTNAVSQNISPNRPDQGHLHIRTEYDSIYASHIPQIREWLISEGKSSHQRVRNYLAMFDRDVNPQSTESSQANLRVVFTSFSFIDQNPSSTAVPDDTKSE